MCGGPATTVVGTGLYLLAIAALRTRCTGTSLTSAIRTILGAAAKCAVIPLTTVGTTHLDALAVTLLGAWVTKTCDTRAIGAVFAG